VQQLQNTGKCGVCSKVLAVTQYSTVSETGTQEGIKGSMIKADKIR